MYTSCRATPRRSHGHRDRTSDRADRHFSTCFGAPSCRAPPSVYGNMLKSAIARWRGAVLAVNTGWTGGKYGSASACRTRRRARAQRGAGRQPEPGDEFRKDPNFGFGSSGRGAGCGFGHPRTAFDLGRSRQYDATAAKMVDCSSTISPNSTRMSKRAFARPARRSPRRLNRLSGARRRRAPGVLKFAKFVE